MLEEVLKMGPQDGICVLTRRGRGTRAVSLQEPAYVSHQPHQQIPAFR